MITRHRGKGALALLLTITLLALLAGCLQPGIAADPSADMTLASTGDQLSETDSQTSAPSGVLRLWWRTRSTLNPLLDQSRSGQAINSLIYDGLFEIDETGQIQTSLARAVYVLEDQKSALVRLYPDQLFHDGSKVTSSDVKACMDFIKAHSDESPYANALSDITFIEVYDEWTVRIHLGEDASWLGYALTFPIIPASSLADAAIDPIPGTGCFEITSFSSEDGLLLERCRNIDISYGIETIRVFEYDDRHAAQKAFEDDQIDLFLLDADEYRLHHVRSSIRFEQFADNQVFFVSYNTGRNRLFESESRLLFVKKLLASHSLAEQTDLADWCDLTDVPWPTGFYLGDRDNALYMSQLEQLGQSAWPETTTSLTILTVAGDASRLTLAKSIEQVLSENGIDCKIYALPVETFEQSLNRGGYDLALLRATISDDPDSTWLLGPARPISFAGLDQIEQPGLSDFGEWQQLLLERIQAVSHGNGHADDLNDLMAGTLARSPWSLLAFGYSALLYGDRVIGQAAPNKYSPYEGIEELWIWSGQSS